MRHRVRTPCLALVLDYFLQIKSGRGSMLDPLASDTLNLWREQETSHGSSPSVRRFLAMSETEKLIKANEDLARSGPLFPVLFPNVLFPARLQGPESSSGGGLAILTCMDPRVRLDFIPGFERVTSIIRNAG